MNNKVEAKRILLVDGESNLRYLYGLKLNQLGYAVATAENGHQAKQILNSGIKIDLVLSDYNMPVINGIELYNFVAENKPELPFILMATDPKQIKENPVEKAETGHILPKPVDYDNLEEVITTAMLSAA